VILVSWGFLAPVLLPVISICSTVAATVGPWAITAAEIALVLNGLVFIKNLVDAATAPTAAELQKESMAMGEDVNAMGMMAMQIAGDKLGKAVGPKIGGALEGVQGRLANSGTASGTMLANNMTKIGGAMAQGNARADAWAGRDVPMAAGTQAEAGNGGGGAGGADPAPAAATADAPAVAPAAAESAPKAPAAEHAPGGGATAEPGQPPSDLKRGPATNDNAAGAATAEPGDMPTDLTPGQAANDNAAPAPQSNEPDIGCYRNRRCRGRRFAEAKTDGDRGRGGGSERATRDGWKRGGTRRRFATSWRRGHRCRPGPSPLRSSSGAGQRASALRSRHARVSLLPPLTTSWQS
jgi:hypothetical protein